MAVHAGLPLFVHIIQKITGTHCLFGFSTGGAHFMHQEIQQSLALHGQCVVTLLYVHFVAMNVSNWMSDSLDCTM